MKFSLITTLAFLLASPALAQDVQQITPPGGPEYNVEYPPDDAIAWGLLLFHRGGARVIEQNDELLRESCAGTDLANLGCFNIVDGTCDIIVPLDAPYDVRRYLFDHFIARCVGWQPGSINLAPSV